MTIPAEQLICAIILEDLISELMVDGDRCVIAIKIHGNEVERVGCLRSGYPTVKVSRDGRSVDVFPSPGIPEGFSIGCPTHCGATFIAHALTKWLNVAYLEFCFYVFHQALHPDARNDLEARFTLLPTTPAPT